MNAIPFEADSAAERLPARERQRRWRLIFGGAIERRDLGPWAAVRGIVTAGGAP